MQEWRAHIGSADSSLMGRNICSTEGTSCVELETSSTFQCCRSPWRRTYNLHFTKPTQAPATLQICVLIPMDNHSLPPSSRKPFFSTNRGHYGKTTGDQNAELQSPFQWTHLQYNPPAPLPTPPPAAKAEGLLQKKGQKECKSQRSAETRREGLPQRSTHQLVNTKRSVSIENIRARNTRTYIRIEVHT